MDRLLVRCGVAPSSACGGPLEIRHAVVREALSAPAHDIDPSRDGAA